MALPATTSAHPQPPEPIFLPRRYNPLPPERRASLTQEWNSLVEWARLPAPKMLQIDSHRQLSVHPMPSHLDSGILSKIGMVFRQRLVDWEYSINAIVPPEQVAEKHDILSLRFHQIHTALDSRRQEEKAYYLAQWNSGLLGKITYLVWHLFFNHSAQIKKLSNSVKLAGDGLKAQTITALQNRIVPYAADLKILQARLAGGDNTNRPSGLLGRDFSTPEAVEAWLNSQTTPAIAAQNPPSDDLAALRANFQMIRALCTAWRDVSGSTPLAWQ